MLNTVTIQIQTVRETYIGKLLSIPGIPDLQTQQLQDPGFLTQLTLDAAVLSVLKNIDQEQLGSLEICTREFIFKIHKTENCCP